MKFSKKLLAVLLAGVLALTMLTACGSSQVNVDLERSKAILEVINTKRAESGMEMGELTLSESASQQLGAWAKAAAAQNADPTKANAAATEAAKIVAKYAVGNLTIDGKKIVKTWETYAVPGTTAEAVQTAMEQHPEWFVHVTEKDCNYVAIATYGSGDASATVLLMMLVK